MFLSSTVTLMLTFGSSNFGPQDAVGARAVSVMVGTGFQGARS